MLKFGKLLISLVNSLPPSFLLSLTIISNIWILNILDVLHFLSHPFCSALFKRFTESYLHKLLLFFFQVSHISVYSFIFLIIPRAPFVAL